MSRAVEGVERARLAVLFVRSWASFDVALTEIQRAGLSMDDVQKAARDALAAVGVEAPSGPDVRAADWVEAVAAYDDLVLGYCETCDRPKLEADVCTGATDEDGDLWICQACVDVERAAKDLRGGP